MVGDGVVEERIVRRRAYVLWYVVGEDAMGETGCMFGVRRGKGRLKRTKTKKKRRVVLSRKTLLVVVSGK